MTAGKPRLTQVTIDSIVVPSGLISWNFSPTDAQTIKSMDINLSRTIYDTIPNLETNPRGLTVVVKRGVTLATEDTVFQGTILTRETLGNKVKIKSNDKLYDAVQKNVTKTFDSNVDTEAGKISEIFKTLINDFTDATADGTSVQDSGTVLILEKFICNNADVFERLEVLAELLDWQFYYNPEDDLVHFEPKGTRAGLNTLTIGDNVTNRPRYIRDGTKVVKKAKIFGGPIQSQTQETFNGDGIETEFTLAKISVDTKVTVDGTLQLGGVKDQASALVDYFVEKVSKATNESISVGKIVFASGSIPASGTNNIVVDYSFLSPIAIDDENAIDNGLEVRLDKPDLITVEDVRQYLTKYMQRHSVDFLSTQLAVTNVTDLDVGQTTTVIDTNEDINQTFIVTKIVKSFPYRFDVVNVDTEPIQIEDWLITLDDRIRRIEERLLQDETVVIHLRNGNRTIKIGVEWHKLEKRLIADGGGENSFILGHNSAGVLGTNLLGDRRQAVTLQFLQQGGNVYLEDFLNDDFEGAGTASWSSTGSVTFTSGQIALSTEIDFNNGTITQAIITPTISSGTFTLELSADGGSNFETVTSGVLHLFTNTGTDLRFRITESAASTGTITEVKIESYH